MEPTTLNAQGLEGDCAREIKKDNGIEGQDELRIADSKAEIATLLDLLANVEGQRYG